MNGFPFDIPLQPPILVGDLLGDNDFEIIGKSIDSTSIYILSLRGKVLNRLSSYKNENLICIESIDNFNSIVTNQRILNFK